MPQGGTPEGWTATAHAKTVQDDWAASFGDATLSALIAEALENNFGLEAANYQVKAAEAAARISNAARFPTLGIGLRSGKQQSRISAFGFQKITSKTNSLELSSQWEIDLWNRLGNGYQAARSQYEATRLDYESFRLSLAAQVTKAWFNHIESTRQLELAQDTAQTYASNLRTIEKRYQRGVSSSFDLRLVRAQAATSRAAVHNRRAQSQAAARQLEIVLGRYPSGSIISTNTLPQLSDTPPAGLPSELLERRPDVLAAQHRLASTLLQNRATQKNWLPRIALTGDAGTSSEELSDLLDQDFSIWSVFGDVTAPIFQAGRLKAERLQSDALASGQIAQYQNTVLVAFQEVERALSSEADLKELETQIAVAAEENEGAAEQSIRLYERGLIDITSALDAQRRSFDAQSQLINARNQRLQNRIDLYLALGGNFESKK